MAVNRQLAEQDGMEEQQQQQVPFVVPASGSSLRLSPPSDSKLARRRQRSSQPKGGPVSATELCQLLAPLVIVGDCAWTLAWNSRPQCKIDLQIQERSQILPPLFWLLSLSGGPRFFQALMLVVQREAACSHFSKCLLSLMQRFRSTSAQGLHTRVMGGGRGSVKFGLNYWISFYSCNSVQKSEHLSWKLSSDTKGQPVVLLPRYNWNHCELSLCRMFSLPVCICVIGPSADAYKFMQYGKMKAVLSWKGWILGRGGLEGL